MAVQAEPVSTYAGRVGATGVNALRISVLGQLSVTRDGHSVSLPQSKKARTLLAYLAITGRRRTRAQLCDMFWDVADDPRAGLRWCLSRLRSVLNDDVTQALVSDRSSVGLADDGVATDMLAVATRMCADDVPVGELQEMAEQFRGPLLEGLDFPDLHAVQAWLIAQRSEARRLHIEVLERLLSQLNDAEQAVPYAMALVQVAPDKEQGYVRLVQLLCAAERKVEAKQQYEAGMNELQTHGSDTHALRLAWRRGTTQTPAASADSQPHEQLPSSPFVGREHELETLDRLASDAQAGRGGTLTIAGEPGIGKSRLLQEFTRRANGRRVRILLGRCTNAAYAIPYLPFIEALDAAASDLPVERITAEAPLLARILPQLATRRGVDLAPSATDGRETDRYVLFRAVAALLVELAGDDGLVLVLEDLHWGDTQSLLMMSYLARLLSETRVLLIGTYRDVEVSRTHPLRETLVALQREKAHTRISLRRLPTSAAESLIAELTSATPEVVEAIFAKTEGHPLFIEEVVKHLLEEGQVGAHADRDTAEPVRLGIPEGVRDAIGRRVSRLSDDCNRMLANASAITGEIPWAVLVQVCKRDEDELLDYLDEALAAQVIRERTSARAGSYEFTHALIQQALYDELSTSRRLRLHRRIGDAIEHVYAGHLEPHLSSLAHHYWEAAPAGELGKFVDYSIRAGERANSLMAFEEAAQLYTRALGAMDELEHEGDGERARIHELLAHALESMNDWPAAREQYARALARTADDDLYNQARLTLHAAVCEFWMLDIEAVRALATKALANAESVSDATLIASAMGLLAQADMSDGRIDAATAKYATAQKHAGTVAEKLVAQSLQQIPISLYWAGRFGEAVEAGQGLLKAARAHADGSMVMNVLAVLGMALGCAGRYRDSAKLFREGEEFGRDHGIARLLARSKCMQAGCALDLGAVDAAYAQTKTALETATTANFAPSIMSTRLDLLLIDIRRGHIGSAENRVAAAEQTLATTRGFHGWVWAMRVTLAHAQLALIKGDPDLAFATASSLVEEAKRTGRVKYEVAAMRVVADALVAKQQPDEAMTVLRTAATRVRTITYPALTIDVAGDLLALGEDAEIAAVGKAAVQSILDELDDPMLRTAFESSVAVVRLLAT